MDHCENCDEFQKQVNELEDEVAELKDKLSELRQNASNWEDRLDEISADIAREIR